MPKPSLPTAHATLDKPRQRRRAAATPSAKAATPSAAATTLTPTAPPSKAPLATLLSMLGHGAPHDAAPVPDGHVLVDVDAQALPCDEQASTLAAPPELQDDAVWLQTPASFGLCAEPATDLASVQARQGPGTGAAPTWFAGKGANVCAGAQAESLVLDVPELIYHADRQLINASLLKRVLRSPAHARAYLDGTLDECDSPARMLGRAVHCAMLEPMRFASEYVAWSGDRRGAEFKEFARQHSGCQILREDEMRRVRGAVQAIVSNDSVFALGALLQGLADAKGQQLMEPAAREKVIVWRDPTSQLMCKARLDLWQRSPNIIFDLKTCEDARPEAFARDIARLDYDLQAAMYSEAVEIATGQSAPPVVLGAVETKSPHNSCFYVIGHGSDVMRNGQRKLAWARAQVARARESGHWPGYEQSALIEPQLHPWQEWRAPTL